MGKPPDIGFMQGRLSPLVGGRIQAFPWEHWRREFPEAERCGFTLMEWTLDHARLSENPIITPEGRREVRRLAEGHGVRIRSLTGDFFMQAPFHRVQGGERARFLEELGIVVRACAEFGISILVVPLVDNGRLEDGAHEEALLEGMGAMEPLLRDAGMRIVFESDYPPARLRAFMERFPADAFGVNYDIGNSASLGFDGAGEIAAYGDRIVNVHVKDRVLGGTTVPLGEGNAEFPKVFEALEKAGYRGSYILQTARAADGDHAEALCRYRGQVLAWMEGKPRGS